MRSAREHPDASEAFGGGAPAQASEAFGQKRSWVPRARSLELVRLPSLLVCLGLSLFALVRSESVFTRGERAAASAGSEPSASLSPCGADRSLTLATVTADELLDLRASVEAALRPAGGREYELGTVSPTAVWTDNPPVNDTLERLAGRRWPGSLEIRQWAPDPQWGASYRDDLVGDVFLFSTSRQASRFFREATSVKCHRSGLVRPAARPAKARNLTWINPDGETEEDVFLRHGRLVYRIVDVRPQNHEPPPSRHEKAMGIATVEALACNLPGAVCSGVHRLSQSVRAVGTSI
jgi:hypothetical protein